MQDKYYDNTRLSEFKSCPRKYFFRHYMDWTFEGFAPALLFGSSWHAAMDCLWPIMAEGDNAHTLSTKEIAIVAYDAFLTEWIKGGGPNPDETDGEVFERLEPRTPMNAMEMIYAYVDERRSLFQRKSFELLGVEVPFAVPLDPEDDNLYYVGRLDKVFRLKDGIYVGEHKTSSLYAKASTFRYNFIDSFSPNSQVDGYIHALNMLYPDEKIAGVWVDAALVHKTVHDGFKIIPVEKRLKQLEGWLWEATYWVDQIENNKEALASMDPSAPYMHAFPKNTGACQDFARNCTYIDICRGFPNPMGQDTPAGMKKEHWSPYERLELGELGLEEQK